MSTPFPAFHEAYPPGRQRTSFDGKAHGAFLTGIPEQLATEWRSVGFGDYGGGLIWTLPPDRPVCDLRDWPMIDRSAVQIVRSGFASVGIWQHDRFEWLNTLTGKVTTFGPRADTLFDFALITDTFRSGVLMEPLYREAVQSLGQIGPDECFGFAPLPALGGAVEAEYLIKTNMREYVALAGHVLQN